MLTAENAVQQMYKSLLLRKKFLNKAANNYAVHLWLENVFYTVAYMYT